MQFFNFIYLFNFLMIMSLPCFLGVAEEYYSALAIYRHSEKKINSIVLHWFFILSLLHFFELCILDSSYFFCNGNFKFQTIIWSFFLNNLFFLPILPLLIVHFYANILSCTGLTLNKPGDLAISLGTSDTVSKKRLYHCGLYVILWYRTLFNVTPSFCQISL